MAIKGDIVKSYIDKFPDAPSASLARMVVRDHPLHFDDLDTTRAMVRYYRGSMGEKSRRYKVKKPLDKLADGLVEIEDMSPIALPPPEWPWSCQTSTSHSTTRTPSWLLLRRASAQG